jgi:hypothetical protein
LSSAPQFYPTESPRTQLRVVHSDRQHRHLVRAMQHAQLAGEHLGAGFVALTDVATICASGALGDEARIAIEHRLGILADCLTHFLPWRP